jgi:galactokinase
MIQELYARFKEVFGREPTLAVRAPGRVNLIGEHTDYNEGFVLPMAIDRQVIALAAPSVPAGSNTVRLYSQDYGQLSSFELDDIKPSDDAEWSNYVRGVAVALREHGQPLKGADMAIAGDVPRGAGLSSSAALEIASGYTLALLAGAPVDKVQLALWGQEAENKFVGVQTGIMDQFISALGQRDAALCIDCRNLTYRVVPLGLEQHGVSVVVVESGVQRGLVDSEYNTRKRECVEGVRLLQELMPNRHITALRDISVQDFEAHGAALPEIVRKRVRHVVTENERVLQSVAALEAGELARFGELMYESHISMRDDYQITVPPIDRLIELARQTPGVIGTRMTGGGFGGSTVHLVETKAVDRFNQEVVERYMAETKLTAPMYVCQAVDGVGLLNPPA